MTNQLAIAKSFAIKFSMAKIIKMAVNAGMAEFLTQHKLCFQAPTLQRIAAGAMIASDSTDLAEMITGQRKQMATILNCPPTKSNPLDKKRRGTTSIGDFLLPLIIPLGVQADKTP